MSNTYFNRQKTGKLKVEKIMVGNLTEEQIQRFWELFSSAYDNCFFDVFLEDLKNKDFVFVGRDTGDNSIQGFCTCEIMHTRLSNNQKVISLYTGDTMFSKEYWGQGALNSAFCKLMFKTKLMNPSAKVFWLLICMGCRTYMIMARNFLNYYPCYNRKTPTEIENLRHEIGFKKFGIYYDNKNGIVRFPQKLRSSLKNDVAPIREKELEVPEIRFMTQLNPNYMQGEELLCLGEVSFKSIFFTLTRAVKSQCKSSIRLLMETRKKKLVGLKGESL